MSVARSASARLGWVAGLVLAVAATAPAQSNEKPVLHQGQASGDNVYVRSGPSLNHYTVTKLRKGDPVQIVGETGEWYEMLPPPGVFSLISGDYVDSADNRTGVVNAENVRVRAGSQLNDNKYTVQTVLTKGTTVEILERAADGFVRIKPPKGATLWISKAFVSTELGSGGGTKPSDSTAPEPARSDRAEPAGPNLEGTPPAMKEYEEAKARGESERKANAEAVKPGTEPTGSETAAGSASASTSNRKRLEELDGEVRLELAKPPAGRDLRPFLEQYQRIAETDADAVNKQYAEARADQLRGMIAVLSSIRSLRGTDEKAETIRQEYLRQRAAMPQYARPKEPVSLDAKGELRVSALYPLNREPKRLRLLDHGADAERTLGYVEIPLDSSIDLQRYLGAYVGVRASGKRWQDGSVNPVPIYVASELVLLDPETDEAVGAEAESKSAAEPDASGSENPPTEPSERSER